MVRAALAPLAVIIGTTGAEWSWWLRGKSSILYGLYCEYQFTPRQRRDPLLYWPRALFLICRLLAVGSISTPVVT